MSIIDLKCENSIYTLLDYRYVYKNKEILSLGGESCYENIVYLYFNLISYCPLRNLEQAKLILYKIPNRYDIYINNQDNKSCCYSVSPLKEFFNAYSGSFCPPEVDETMKIYFTDKECCSYTEVDITPIVKAWINGRVENKGIVLMENNYAPQRKYASHCYNMREMRPVLRLIYEGNCICEPMFTTPCTIDINI